MFEGLLPALAPDVIGSCFAIAFGFGVAGLGASSYRLYGEHFPSFRLLEVGPMAASLCRCAAADLLRAVSDHAQHAAWPAH